MPTTSSRQTLLLAAIVAVIVFVALAATMDDIGLTWDEPAYMGSAQAYASWYTVLGRSLLRLQPGQAFSPAVLDQYWQQEEADLHPPMGKVLPALTWRLLRGQVGDLTALRLGNALIFAALAGLVCLMGAQMAGPMAGVFAAASLVLMPRLFFHGHLTALDIPVSFAWLLTVWILWRWYEGGGKRAWPAVLPLGLAFGLALATKNTSFLLPVILFLWLLLFKRTPQAALLLAGMVLIAAVVFVAVWPFLYRDPLGHLELYLRRMTVGHWDISQYYLGSLYQRPPWHYPFVIIVATVPSTILAVALLGAAHTIASIDVRSLLRLPTSGPVRKSGVDAAGWLVLLNVLGPLLFFSFVSSQAYGGERLFLVIFPFLALLAGIGFAWIWQQLREAQGAEDPASPGARMQRVAGAVLAVLVLVPGLLGIVSMHPYELSYFSAIIGGTEGAEKLGLELTYWCETYRETLPFLNDLPEQGASVWTEEDGVLYTYQKVGLLRSDLQVGGRVVKAGPLAADYALIQRRPSGYTPEINTLMAERQPVFVVEHSGVALAYLYKIR